jgi:hypothetical protein
MKITSSYYLFSKYFGFANSKVGFDIEGCKSKVIFIGLFFKQRAFIAHCFDVLYISAMTKKSILIHHEKSTFIHTFNPCIVIGGYSIKSHYTRMEL